MQEKDYELNNLTDDKMLFDEILPSFSSSINQEQIEREYKSGIAYEQELKKHKSKK